MKKITGQLTGPQDSGLPKIPFGITIELSTLPQGAEPGSWIGSAVVNVTDARFELFTVYNLDVREQVAYAVLSGSRVVQNGTATVIEQQLDIALDTASAEALFDSDATGHFHVKGQAIMASAGFPAVPAIAGQFTVKIWKDAFRNPVVLSQVTLDAHGRYEATILKSEVMTADGPCKTAEAVTLRVSLYDGDTILAGPVPVRADSDCITADIPVVPVAGDTRFRTELAYLLKVLSDAVNITPAMLKDIQIKGADSELAALCAATGLREDLVITAVNAAGLASELGIALDIAYALLRIGVTEVYRIVAMGSDELFEAVTLAAALRYIDPVQSLDGVIGALEQKRGRFAGNELTANEDTWLTVCSAVLGSEALGRSFMKLYALSSSPEELWELVTTEMGAEKATRMQKALQVLAITGMQPELTVSLLNSLNGLPVESLRTLQHTDWLAHIADASALHGGKSCIPKVIQQTSGPAEQAGKYATLLQEATQEIFATAVLDDALLADAAFAGKVGDTAAVRAFFAANKEFDLRVDNVWDIADETVRTALMPLQNIIRITGGLPQTVIALIKDNMRSAAHIAAISEDEFTGRFLESFNGDMEKARGAYNRAVHTSRLHLLAKAEMQSSAYLTSVFPMTAASQDNAPAALAAPSGPVATPDVQTLFGNMDLCSCSECSSMYSPGAYFTDILHFIQKKLGSPAQAFEELKRRRPDLVNIDLSCKNANTSLPYIDLVNELLEKVILKAMGVPVPSSFQTSGTATELGAYPEHTYKADGAYQDYTGYQVLYEETLKEAVYPNNLPFDLPLEENRTYLKHLGAERYDLMYAFRPYDFTGSAGPVNEHSAQAEWMKITVAEAGIISGNHSFALMPYMYYGLPELSASTPAVPWYDVLARGENGEGIGTLLFRSRVTYKEMLQMLNTDFLNPSITIQVVENGQTVTKACRTFEIWAVAGAPPDTCDTTKLYLKFMREDDVVSPAGNNEKKIAKTVLFSKWHRFLRLQRATGWTAAGLDMVLQSFRRTGQVTYLPNAAYTVSDIDQEALRYVIKTHQLSVFLKQAPERICSLWSTISTRHYIDFNAENQREMPSVYDQLFRNKAVMNPPAYQFQPNGSILGAYSSVMATLQSALGISEEEVYAIAGYLGVNTAANAVVSLADVSTIYGIAQLCKGLKLPVTDLLRIVRFLEIGLPGSSPYATFDSLEALLAGVERIRKIAFSLDELAYLVTNEDEQGSYRPDDDTIAAFYTAMRSDLQKVDVTPLAASASPEEVLLWRESISAQRLAIAAEHYSAAFGLDRKIARLLMDFIIMPVKAVVDPSGSAPVSKAIVEDSFAASAGDPAPGSANPPLPVIPGNEVAAFFFSPLYTVYRMLGKTAMIMRTLKLSYEELRVIHNVGAALGISAVGAMPAGAPTATAPEVEAFLRLNEWIMVRDRLGAGATRFAGLLKSTAGGVLSEWSDIVTEITRWNSADLNQMLTITGLNTNDPGFALPGLLLQMSDMVALSGRIGMNVATVYALLSPYIDLELSKNVRMVAKARHSEEEWAAIAKPLQDALRERQRRSLVSYIVGRPGILSASATGNTICRNEDELFEFLLIDVAMQPCMKTSRIKQAISSVQLFMDRVLLSEENVGGNFGNPIRVPAEKAQQWESWRKWYRIWEANRKIFLYPENWIEPELRDNKTPFFKELETQLLQDEVKDDTAEDAFLAYLERVDEVARLEPVSAYRETDARTGKDVLHVFGRTQAVPHRYFYRRLQHNEWSPWEKMNVDIKGDHMVPVVWNSRLYVFWLTFQKKSMSSEEKEAQRRAERTGRVNVWNRPSTVRNVMHNWGAVMTGKNDAGLSANADPMPDGYPNGRAVVKDGDDTRYTRWDITLNWSQLKDDKWLPVEMNDDTMSMAINKMHLSDKAEASYAVSLQNVRHVFSFLTGNGDIKLDELFRNRLYLYARPNNYEYGMFFNLLFPVAMNENAIGSHTFMWSDQNRQPYVLHNDFIPDSMTAPANTRFNRMKFVEDPLSDGKLKVDRLNMTPGELYGYYSYSSDTYYQDFERPFRTSSEVLLNNTPNGRYRLTAPANTETISRPEVFEGFRDRFFFEDDKHTFFVQKEEGTYLTQKTLLSDLRKVARIRLDTPVQFAKLTYGVTRLNGASYDLLKPIQATTSVKGMLYRFHTFYHAQINDFIRELYRGGVPGLLNLRNQRQADTMNFSGNYQPNTGMVHNAFPANNVQFGFDEAYSAYNWEIFFHTPMLIAQRLSDNQQFAEARKWYHYIFDPTSSQDELQGVLTGDRRRFWKFYPFYRQSQQPVETLTQLLEQIHGNFEAALAQVDKWENNPFQPHVIARMRIMAYMKNVLMKYLDNLIAWGDQLFRRDTIESINEATQLYILAGQLLGQRPAEVPARAGVSPKSYDDLDESLDALSNAMVQIESYFAPNGGPLPASSAKDDRGLDVQMFYFCLPKNDKLLRYWDTVADRLFKIRNCMNIDGAARELPLFEPPVDPALLVKAAAKGISIGSLLDSISGSSQSPYRFSYVLQKANEFCNDVKGLGAALLLAIEKKDAEQLALLRSGQEMKVLEQVRYIRELQVQEAEAGLEAARKVRDNTRMRQLYYSSRVFMNSGESQHLSSLQTGMVLQAVQSGTMAAVSATAMIPQFHGQATFAVGPSFGGQQISAMLNALSAGIGIAAAINSGRGAMALTRAGYERRMDDWQFQSASAAKELEQLEQQILASEIRLDMARKELDNHDLQVSHNAETDAYMRNKFSNAELYNWTISQVSATYFQSYQLAFDMAKKAEACFDLELPAARKPAAGFVGFAYWDSLRKGLLSGEKLQADLRKMEAAYMDSNKRTLELTRNCSLAVTDPVALLQLRRNGSCTFSLPEELYDMEYPGHYQRRIKSVSISLPCVAGPYTTVAATLTLQQSSVRRTPDAGGGLDTESITARPAIATSTGQRDSGVFELNFRDERYLPFEGRGAVSEWELRLADPDQVRLFDFATLSDVIIHISYTAMDGGAQLRQSRIAAVNGLLENATADATLLLPRYCSMKHDFGQQWYAGQHATAAAGATQLGRPFSIPVSRDLFPAFTAGRQITVKSIDAYLKTEVPIPDNSAAPVTYHIICGQDHELASASNDHAGFSHAIVLDAGDAPATLSFTLYKKVGNAIVALSPGECADLFFVMNYKIG